MTGKGTCCPIIDISSLPDISMTEIDFHETSYFNSSQRPSPQLPTPASILQQYPNHGAGVIKYEDQTFIYMSLIHGRTLREAWPSLTEADKESICGELSGVIAALRRITQGSSSRFIGSINGGAVQDRFFLLDYEEGPIISIKSFHDWFLAAATRQRPGPQEITGPYRDLLPDTGNIYFTHGDLTLGNIIISGTPGSQRIVSILDWEQAGWYPEYWEYCKLLYGVEYSHEWRSAGWVEKVTASFDDKWFVFAEYFLWRCP